MPIGQYRRDKVPPRTKSGLKGVIYQPFSWSQRREPIQLAKPWKVYIFDGAEHRYIGHFATKREAAIAYNEAAVKIYGRDTYLNPIPEDNDPPKGYSLVPPKLERRSHEPKTAERRPLEFMSYGLYPI